jgi:hypothetical protein
MPEGLVSSGSLQSGKMPSNRACDRRLPSTGNGNGIGVLILRVGAVRHFLVASFMGTWNGVVDRYASTNNMRLYVESGQGVFGEILFNRLGAGSCE